MFVYARPEHTARTLEALAHNALAADSVLNVFCDGPKAESDVERCEETRRIASGATGFREVRVFRSERNKGLATSIIEGISSVLETEDRVVVMEDDLVTTGHFLTFLNEGLERYREEKRVYAICGYSPPMAGVPKDYPFDAFFCRKSMSWGWATWRDRWQKVDWEVRGYESYRRSREAQRRFTRSGKDFAQMIDQQMAGLVDSWAIRWNFTLFEQDGLALLPLHSFVQNIGADGTGTHFKGTTDRYVVDLSQAKPVVRWPDSLEVDPRLERAFAACYSKTFRRGVKKAVRIFKGALGMNRQ
jgi:hypothetical protein